MRRRYRDVMPKDPQEGPSDDLLPIPEGDDIDPDELNRLGQRADKDEGDQAGKKE